MTGKALLTTLNSQNRSFRYSHSFHFFCPKFGVLAPGWEILRVRLAICTRVCDGADMPKRKPKRKPKPDAAQTALKAVCEAVGIKPMRGESLLGSPELKRKLREAKKRIKQG